MMDRRCQSRIKFTQILVAFGTMLALSLTITAQDNQQSQYDRGTPPQHSAGVSSIGSYISADIGTINLGNGSLNFRLPLGNVGGRGLWLPLTLNYASKIWSARRGDIFNPDPAPGHRDPVVWGQYGDDTTDIYNFIAGGWTIGAAPFLKARGIGINAVNNPQTACTDYTWVLVKLTLVLPDKGEIELRDDWRDGEPIIAQTFPSTGCRQQDGYRGQRWHAADGSGAIFINDNDNGVVNGNLAGVVITSDGTRYHFVTANGDNFAGSANLNTVARCNWVEDRNGNKIQITYPNGLNVIYTDQLGRTTTVRWDDPFDPLYDPENPGVRLAVLITFPGYNGSLRYYKVKTGAMNQNYRGSPNPINPALPVFNGDSEFTSVGTALFNGGTDAGLDYIDGKPVLTQLILPDGRALMFKYNEYGEVAEMQVPTGGKVQYDYQAVLLDPVTGTGLPVSNSLNAEAIAPGGGNVRAVDRAVVERRTYPDGSSLEGQWVYSYKASQVNGVSTGSTEIKCFSASGQLLLDELHYFLPAQRFLTGTTGGGVDGTGYSIWSTGLERRSEHRDTNGTTVLAASEQDSSQRAPVSWTSFTTQQIANDNRVDETRKILNDGSAARAHMAYDQYNNLTRVDEYDFDGTLKRYNTTSYVTGSPYTGNGINTRNLVRLPLQESVFDGATSLEMARTSYEYDNYSTDSNNQALATYADFFSIPGHTASYSTSFTARGNSTRVTRMVDSSTSLDSYTRFDVLGNVVSSKDPRGNVATISYLDDFGNGSNPGFNNGGKSTYSLATKIESPPPNPGEPKHTAYSQYDFSTGLLTGFKNRNGTITQTIYNDPFDRPTQNKVALGTSFENHTAMYYGGLNPLTVYGVTLTNNDVLTANDQVGIDDGNLRSWVKTDGFGRTIDSFVSDPQGDIRTTATYDGLGRAKRITNPYRSTSDPAYGYTETTFDMLGRPTRVETFDGNGASIGAVTTSYSGNQVTSTDQAFKVRRSVTDGLGRLKQVIEDPNGLAYSTSYGYDALDDLTSVTQGVQSRTFVYDRLKRLTQAINPESGAMNYTYDANSNLLTRRDARLITTTFAYDTLNRVTSRIYTGDSQSTPAVFYKYDGQTLPAGAPSFTRGSSIGRLVATTYGGTSAGSYQGYDQLGHANVSVQQTDSQNYGFGYVYNLAGEMTSETYPSERVITTGFDTAGRLSSVNGQKTGEANKTYASQFSYVAHGAVAAVQLGNGKWEHTMFNRRLQPTQIGLGTSTSDSSILRLDYGYGTTSNNGNVLTQTITAPGLTLTQCYGYDGLNRLLSAEERTGSNCTGPQHWKQAFSYDRYGNRNFDATITTANVLGPNPTISQSDNRFAAGQNYGYDSAGNLTSDPATNANGIVYDAENRQTQHIKSQQATNFYFYDGEGRRVKKIDSSGTTVFVYNVGGQLIAEYTSGPPLGGGTSYLTTDHLGSTRVVTRADGSVKARYDYLPFGEEISSTIGGRGSNVIGYGGADSTKQKFTQKERDNESGLDYFLARYYSSAQGRFTSPDEFAGGAHEFWVLGSGDTEKQALPYADITNPQSLNKYQYCLNNSLRYVDPDGHQEGAALRQDQDVKDLAEGRITEKEYWDRQRGKAVGAVAGLAVVGAAILGPRVGIAILGWMVRNPEKVQQGAEDLIQASQGNPALGPRLGPGQAEQIGASIGASVRRMGSGKMATIASRVTEQGLSQGEAVTATEAAVKSLGLNLKSVAQTDGSVVVASVQVGKNQPVLIINQGGQVTRGTATISAGMRDKKPFFEVKDIKSLN
jgi:RHS repeat-associated protein